MGAEVLLDETVGGNRIQINDQGGVITMFGIEASKRVMQETYQLEGNEAQDLVDMMKARGPAEMLTSIPAHKIVDLSVGVSRGEITPEKLDEVVDKFESNPKIMKGYHMWYEMGIKRSGGSLSEPRTDVDAIEAELEGMLRRVDRRGHVAGAEELAGDAATPKEMQATDSMTMLK